MASVNYVLKYSSQLSRKIARRVGIMGSLLLLNCYDTDENDHQIVKTVIPKKQDVTVARRNSNHVARLTSFFCHLLAERSVANSLTFCA